MQERPILFSTPMVKAILEGRKSQTRRIIKPQPSKQQAVETFAKEGPGSVDARELTEADMEMDEIMEKCKYEIGDVLWVRETFSELYDYEVHDELPGCPREQWSLGFVYKADGYVHENNFKGFWRGWKPSIHMPKEACRLWLQITDIRIERLQEISEEDAMDEGINSRYEFFAFFSLLNGVTEADNPWLWVIQFNRINKPN